MDTIAGFMGRDHDRLDGLFRNFQANEAGDPAAAKPFFHDFKVGLQRHIVWEEEILFPIFEERTGLRGQGPTEVMRAEHRQIKDFLERIHAAVAAKERSTDADTEGLLLVLGDHNAKEESILYPWIDEALSENERAKVFADMDALPPEKYTKCCA